MTFQNVSSNVTCLSSFLLITFAFVLCRCMPNHPQTQQLETTVCCIIVSVSQESRMAPLILWLRVCRRAVVILNTRLWEDPLPSSLTGWRLASVSPWLWAPGIGSLPLGLPIGRLTTWQLPFPLGRAEREERD